MAHKHKLYKKFLRSKKPRYRDNAYRTTRTSSTVLCDERNIMCQRSSDEQRQTSEQLGKSCPHAPPTQHHTAHTYMTMKYGSATINPSKKQHRTPRLQYRGVFTYILQHNARAGDSQFTNTSDTIQCVGA